MDLLITNLQKKIKNSKIFINKIFKKLNFSLFLARISQRNGQLLGCLWVNLAEILGGEWARVWLWTIQILLKCDKVCGSSG